MRIKMWGWREIPHLWKETKEERIVGMRLKLTSLLLITNASEIKNTEMNTTTKNWQTISAITFGIQLISRLCVAVLVTILENAYLIFFFNFCIIWYIYTCQTLVYFGTNEGVAAESDIIIGITNKCICTVTIHNFQNRQNKCSRNTNCGH